MHQLMKCLFDIRNFVTNYFISCIVLCALCSTIVCHALCCYKMFDHCLLYDVIKLPSALSLVNSGSSGLCWVWEWKLEILKLVIHLLVYFFICFSFVKILSKWAVIVNIFSRIKVMFVYQRYAWYAVYYLFLCVCEIDDDNWWCSRRYNVHHFIAKVWFWQIRYLYIIRLWQMLGLFKLDNGSIVEVNMVYHFTLYFLCYSLGFLSADVWCLWKAL